MKKSKKETKIQELERRISQIEAKLPSFYPPYTPNNFMSTNQSLFYCRFCGGYVYSCPGHTIC